jgi:hypothetical protein
VTPKPAIEVYPVGLLSDLLVLGRAMRLRRRQGILWALGRVLACFRYMVHQARQGNWRAVKNTFNGYLAEPVAFPERLRRCGSGWTKKRALRSLNRHLRRAGVE